MNKMIEELTNVQRNVITIAGNMEGTFYIPDHPYKQYRDEIRGLVTKGISHSIVGTQVKLTRRGFNVAKALSEEKPASDD